MNQHTISNRRKNSSGQAIVLVTLGLLAMCGMMGLAVDTGWAFFVHKQAQTSADAAALGAVGEAYKRLTAGAGAVSTFTCGAGGTGSTQLDCQTTKVNCASVAATSNLNNGCQYALKNGFDWTTSRQNVTMQSNDGATANLPPTAPGVVNIVYWVTVRTVQTVPQLFSAVNGTTEGTVSAVATAAIAASIGPGQFYGMNRRGDCTNVDPATGTGGINCGEDFTGAPGAGSQTNCGSSKAGLCAPAGIILASQCNTKQAGICSNGTAGTTPKNAMGSSLTIMGDGTTANDGEVDGNWVDMNGNPLVPNYSMAAKTFQDPTAANHLKQPPLASELPAGSQIGACGYPGGVIPAGVTLGPYQYYSYTVVAGAKVPDGKQLQFNGNTFSTTATGCPDPNNKGFAFTAGVSQGSSALPTYIFYGGMNASGTINMGPGQYVMAGTKTADQPYVFQEFGATINATTAGLATGTMWVFTDGNYPGMSTQLQAISNTGVSVSSIQNLDQGSLNFKNGDITLSGLIGSANQGSSLPPALDSYSGITWWQDRRNSDVGYNQPNGSPGCTALCSGDDGTVIICGTNGDCPDHSNSDLAAMMQANHVTINSPGLVMDPGKANIALQGVFYQPRGAWMDFVAGNAGFTCDPATIAGAGPNSQCPLEVITGALLLDKGTVGLMLAGPTNPIITYKPVLIH